MKFNSPLISTLGHSFVFTIAIIIIHHLATSTSSPSMKSLGFEDFQHLTDKLTHKIMQDIERMKAEDPNWGQPPEDMSEEDMTHEQMKMISECEFHCPSGKDQAENPNFKMPAFKNCKKYDSMWDRIPGASGCCMRHQVCYHTCARERTQCDMEFNMCMENICEELEEKKIIETEKVIEACQSAMKMLGIMIMEPGCKMYPKAQDAACLCVEKDPDTDVDDDSQLGGFNILEKGYDNGSEHADKSGKKGDIINNDEGNEDVGDIERTIANDDGESEDDGNEGIHDSHDEL